MIDDFEHEADAPAYAIPAHVLHRQVEGQMVLLDLDREQYFGLDEVGADIISRLTTYAPEAALSALLEEYDVDPEVLRRDAQGLVEQLLEAGLLERTRGQA